MTLSCTAAKQDHSLKVSAESKRTIMFEGPFQDFIYNRVEDIFNVDQGSYEAPYQTVKVTFEGASFDASMRLRGGVRFCLGFPQLKLKLPKTNLIDNQREFKIITHGTHPIDPKIPINAPDCSDSFSQNDWRESHRFENILYGLSTELLDFHLKTSTFDARYVDSGHGLDLTEQAYFVEDKDAAAKRYGLETVEIGGINGRHPWRADDEELNSSLLEDEAITYLSQEYKNLQQKHPTWSKVELGKAVGTFQELAQKPAFADIQARAAARFDETKLQLKGEQLALLASFDSKSLAQAVLFNSLIQNTDWNVLGIIKTSSTSIKNVELMQDAQKNIFVIPYDFNESIWNIDSSRVTTAAEYKQSLLIFVADMRNNMDGYLIAALKEEIPIFISRLRSLDNSSRYSEFMRTQFRNFTLALQDVESSL